MIKRPKTVEPQFDSPDVRIAEDLVRKSLQLNPQLKGGHSTHKFLENMRDIVLGRAQTSEAAAGTPGSEAAKSTNSPSVPAAAGDHRSQTAHFFLQQKSSDFQGEAQALQARFEAEKKKLRQRLVDEVVDFLVVVWSGCDITAALSSLKTHQGLLEQLGVTPEELIGQARQRGK